MFKLFLAAILLVPSSMALSGEDPRSIIPTHTRGDYMESGVFGDKFQFSENTIVLLNYIDWMLDTHNTSQDAQVDITVYGQSEVTMNEGFNILSGYMTSADVSNLDDADWTGGAPATVWEAIDRLAKAYAAQHAQPVP